MKFNQLQLNEKKLIVWFETRRDEKALNFTTSDSQLIALMQTTQKEWHISNLLIESLFSVEFNLMRMYFDSEKRSQC